MYRYYYLTPKLTSSRLICLQATVQYTQQYIEYFIITRAKDHCLHMTRSTYMIKTGQCLVITRTALFAYIPVNMTVFQCHIVATPTTTQLNGIQGYVFACIYSEIIFIQDNGCSGYAFDKQGFEDHIIRVTRKITLLDLFTQTTYTKALI